jgi:Beta-galactosidase
MHIPFIYPNFEYLNKNTNPVKNTDPINIGNVKIGTTYSYREIEYLKLDKDKSLETLFNLKFDYIRLGLYWNDIQPQKGEFDFTKIEQILSKFQEHNQNVVLSIGLKAPRWPEFYFPNWLIDSSIIDTKSYLLEYIDKAIHALNKYTCIKYYQVENEPLDPSGPNNLSIPLSLLEDEIILVKSIDSKETIVNFWGNDFIKRNLYPKVTDKVEIIGIDLYYNTPFLGHFYIGPKDKDSKLAGIFNKLNKDLWITELQAEPWERNGDNKYTSKALSINSSILKRNIKNALTIHPKVILLWGYEYWLWMSAHGDNSLIKTVESIINNKTI